MNIVVCVKQVPDTEVERTLPMGPLKLADLIGLDTLQAVAESLYAEYAGPLYAPPPLLRRMTAAGLLGRKVGRGFFDYQERR